MKESKKVLIRNSFTPQTCNTNYIIIDLWFKKLFSSYKNDVMFHKNIDKIIYQLQ